MSQPNLKITGNYLQPITPPLIFLVVKAEGLYKKSFFSKPDPFAVVTIDGDQTHTTLPDHSTLDPFWNTLCRFVAFESSVVAVQVFDQKRFKKDGQGFLGVANFIVSSVIALNQGPRQSNPEGNLILLFIFRIFDIAIATK